MEQGGYQGGETPGGRWGCTIASIVGVPLMALSFLVGTLGDCIPEEPCHRGKVWPLLFFSLLIAGLAGLGSSALINWLVRRSRRD
ncbi:hypothetical protein [Novosphingobium sp. 9]|uniref:hypothetical protein n=1 Tax=Novosphingobium sp. 9 TaxID=2025349 RepID=UPI0021B4F991|nr:hypothetical protein [Novosphingobium sp. 9]